MKALFVIWTEVRNRLARAAEHFEQSLVIEPASCDGKRWSLEIHGTASSAIIEVAPVIVPLVILSVFTMVTGDTEVTRTITVLVSVVASLIWARTLTLPVFLSRNQRFAENLHHLHTHFHITITFWKIWNREVISWSNLLYLYQPSLTFWIIGFGVMNNLWPPQNLRLEDLIWRSGQSLWVRYELS